MFSGLVLRAKSGRYQTRNFDRSSSKQVFHAPGKTKMYQNPKRQFWWIWMKKDISQFVARCLTFQKMKAEHKCPGGLLQPLFTPQWKWEDIIMDFVIGLPRTTRQKDTIWVVVDRLIKSTHFISISEKDSLKKLSKIYIEEIVRLHGVPTSIVSDRDLRFTSKFLDRMQKLYGTTLKFSTTSHPQIDG
jgi:hypothetical protein